MGDKALRVYTQQWTGDEYEQAAANGDAPQPTDDVGELYLIDQWADDFGDWNQDESAWIPATEVATAVRMLTGATTEFWASECSDSAAETGPGTWYSDQLYTNPYTGEVTAKTAHLVGDWSVEQAREIRAQVITR
jgi:hypothetical protein